MASTLVRAVTQNAQGSSGNANNAVPVPAHEDGDVIVFCFELDANIAVTTLGGTFTALDSATGTVSGKCGYRTASSEPSTYTPTWTGNATSHGVMAVIHNTDGTTPIVDVHSMGTGSPTSQATTVNYDLVVFMSNGNAGQWNGQQGPWGIALNANGSGVGYVGQDKAGSSPTTAFSYTGAGNINSETIAFFSNTPSAALFVGVGTESFHSGSASNVAPTSASNVSVGDIELAAVSENVTPGIAIVPTAPFELSIHNQAQANSAGTVSSLAVTIPASTSVGDLMMAMVSNNSTPSTITGPTCGSSGAWTKVCQDTTNITVTIWTKVAATGDASASCTWNASTTNFMSISEWAVASGSASALSVDASACSHVAATATPTLPVVTTIANQDMVIGGAIQPNNSTPTVPGSMTNINTGATHGWVVGWAGQTIAGVTPTQTLANGNAASAWGTFQVAVKTAYEQSPWTLVATGIDPTLTVSMNVYFHVRGSGDPTTWNFNFVTNPSNSDGLIVDFANVDPANPVDASSVLTVGAMDEPELPSITPTMWDELLMYFSVPGVGYGLTTIWTNGAQNRISANYYSLASAGTQPSGTGNTNAFVTTALGLKTKPR